MVKTVRPQKARNNDLFQPRFVLSYNDKSRIVATPQLTESELFIW